MTYEVLITAPLLATNVIHFSRILRDAGLPLGTRSTSGRRERSEGFDSGRTLRSAPPFSHRDEALRGVTNKSAFPSLDVVWRAALLSVIR